MDQWSEIALHTWSGGKHFKWQKMHAFLLDTEGNLYRNAQGKAIKEIARASYCTNRYIISYHFLC